MQLDASSPDVFKELGNVREIRDETDAAIEAYQKAIELGYRPPEEIERLILGTLATHGKVASLVERALQLLKKDSRNVAARLQLIRTGTHPGGVSAGVEFLAKMNLPRNELVEYAIGEGFDTERNTVKSFEHYKRANKINRQKSSPYSIAHTVEQYRRIRSFYSKFADTLMEPVDEPENFPTPIFVLGIPRSGTSLTEQLLGTHSQIHPAGELQFLQSLCKFGGRQFVGAKRQQSREYWTWVRDTYLQSIQGISEGKAFVIDKMPHNYEFVGFIYKMFPNSIVIHCVRDPIANCLSLFKANFDGYHPYTQDLKTVGHYYFEYSELMTFWKEQPDVEILDSPYEELVEAPRQQVERILKKCDLEWEDQINDFHRSDRIVRTSSRDQVRQPIYKSSLKSWKAYEADLGPLIETLLEHGVIVPSDLSS